LIKVKSTDPEHCKYCMLQK